MKLPCHEKCENCLRIEVNEIGKFCKAYSNPSYWWEKRGTCPLATHTHKMIGDTDKKRVGQQKTKKKSKIKAIK